jgi:NADH-quinone oxidoreductase subunit M
MIFIILGLSLLTSYVLSRKQPTWGAYFTILASLAGLVSVYFLRNSIGITESFYYLNFRITTIGWYFAMILLTVYFTSAFFNPFWMDQLIYPAAYNSLYLLSLVGTVGLFFAQDLLTLFICWETAVWSSMLIVQQGKSRQAAWVYFVVSAIGSMATLFAVLLSIFLSGTSDITGALAYFATAPVAGALVFGAFILAGLTKIGIFPFHVWLPLAHGSAPHTFSPVLSGGLVKMGAYIAYLSVAVFPAYQVFGDSLKIQGVPLPIYGLMLLGAVSIVYGTLRAIQQEDAKRLLAYSSVANGGYILIGILMMDQMAFAGGLMHILNHAVASAAAFLAIAAVAKRTGTTKMSELGGMIHRMPITYTVYLIAIISMAGIPPMGGFVSKWLIFQGLSNSGFILLATAAAFGSIGSYMYVFRPLSAVFLGQLAPKYVHIKEANPVMVTAMLILTAMSLLLGVLPNIVLKTIAKIQIELGINPILINGTATMTNNGSVDMLQVFTVFGFGFLLILILFLVLPKSRRVGLMDTYTSAEFIHTPELLHYGHRFYAPFERLYEKWPSILPLYRRASMKLSELGEWAENFFFHPEPNRAVVWIVVVAIIVIVGGAQ